MLSLIDRYVVLLNLFLVELYVFFNIPNFVTKLPDLLLLYCVKLLLFSQLVLQLVVL